MKPDPASVKAAAEIMADVNLHAFSDVTFDQLRERIAAALHSARVEERKRLIAELTECDKCDLCEDHHG